jgi:hypothetical protein
VIRKKMKKIARLISVVALAMALMIAFSGVASAANWLTEYTPEKQTVNRLIGYDSLWKSSSTSNFGLFEGMNAYSKLVATNVQATTRAEVGMTNNPVLNYEIDAGGSNGWSKGRISAGMSVYVAGDPLLYEDRSSASGLFQFHKEMSYTSGIMTP